MAIDFDKIDRTVDLKGLQADVEDAKKNGGGDFPTIPAGKYEAKVETMEIKGPRPIPTAPCWLCPSKFFPVSTRTSACS